MTIGAGGLGAAAVVTAGRGGALAGRGDVPGGLEKGAAVAAAAGGALARDGASCTDATETFWAGVAGLVGLGVGCFMATGADWGC